MSEVWVISGALPVVCSEGVSHLTPPVAVLPGTGAVIFPGDRRGVRPGQEMATVAP